MDINKEMNDKGYYSKKMSAVIIADAIKKTAKTISIKDNFPSLDDLADKLECTETEKYGIVACVYETIKDMISNNEGTTTASRRT